MARTDASGARVAPRRVLAFAVDYLVIALWAAAVAGISFALGASAGPAADTASKLFGHFLGFLTLTLPVVTYFTLLEARGGTLGKRALGLSVEGGFGGALVRNLLRFLPWEIAHAAIWHVPGRPIVDPFPLANLAVCILSILIVLVYLTGLFVGSGRTLYDRAAGTLVVLARASA